MHEDDNTYRYLRMTSLRSGGCLSFSIPTLLHEYGYLVAVTSRHVSGRPLMISFINNTAKHAEVETLLPDSPDWETTYFILPPLAADGLGYTVYASNPSFGNWQTENELANITFYTIPYTGLTEFHTGIYFPAQLPKTDTLSIIVDHPNPTAYSVILPKISGRNTLILSQSYNPYWTAYDVTGMNRIQQALPFVFGKKLNNHVKVNNWSNGWVLEPDQKEIRILFTPQLAEYAGFGLLITVLLVVFKPKTSIRTLHGLS